MFNNDNEDLSWAPNRKRKTLEENQKKRVIKMVWDIDVDVNTDEMDDICSIETTNNEMEEKMEIMNSGPKLTPPFVVPQELVAPGAPRAMAADPNILLTSDHSNIVQCFAPLKIFIDSNTSNSSLPKSENNEDDIDPWDHFSDEVILCVFSWLPKSVLTLCARVSKRWNRLVFDESLWKRLDLSGKTLHRGVMGRVLNRGVEILRMSKSKVQAPLFMTNSFNQPRLQYLDVSMTTISLSGLHELLSGCHFLRRISLETCQVNDVICRFIGQNKNIEVLNLCMCLGLTENSFVPICNNLKRLDSLNVAWTNMSQGAVVYLVICLPRTLTKLNLSGCRDALKDEDIKQLCESCPNLKELDLSDATILTSESVNHIISGLSDLEYLALSRCYQILPTTLALVCHIRTLLALDVFGMLKETALTWLRETLSAIEVNKFPFSSIARPTTGIRRTSIWGMRVRDVV